MNYQEEKNYLNEIVFNYLSNCPAMCHTFRESGIDNEGKPITINGPIIPLYYYGEIVDTEIIAIFINEFNEIQVEDYCPKYGNGDTNYDMFMEFGNDEMKLIMNKMNLKY